MSGAFLVTGGAGFVGSHVVAALAEAGHPVLVFDNLQQGHRAALPGSVRLVEGDLADAAAIDALFRQYRITAVLHFAAHSLVGDSMRRPFLYLGDNVANGLRLIEACLNHGVTRFVLSSTANVYGTPERVPIPEDAPIDPGSPYGESKHMLERALVWAERVGGLRHACLRYFNAAGAHPDGEIGEDHNPETHLIPLVLQVALGRRPSLTLFGTDYPTPDGTCIRDYIHVCDLAQAHLLALEALADGSRTYNLGNGTGHSVQEVIATARRITGHPIPVETGARRPGDPAVLVASSDQIRRELGWTPRYPDLATIIDTAWHWHRRHPDGFRSGIPGGGGGADDRQQATRLVQAR